jgi:hypothetical protein
VRCSLRCAMLVVATLLTPRHTMLERGRTRVGECEGEPTSSPLAPPRASEARFTLRSRDPVERLARDGVLSEKEAQLGRMFLHVTHAVQEQL